MESDSSFFLSSNGRKTRSSSRVSDSALFLGTTHLWLDDCSIGFEDDLVKSCRGSRKRDGLFGIGLFFFARSFPPKRSTNFLSLGVYSGFLRCLEFGMFPFEAMLRRCEWEKQKI
ncbi:hypothetical protein NPIL_463631 [Nephila pilipes]|uniref:Uncharacterized protein n=1 Tax=Nephila pilipes TaxID=299642 RepID=A0A8X6QK80_NEPPI|nr:hypothetical protein NPIL_463631 [Nephila pilipes]